MKYEEILLNRISKINILTYDILIIFYTNQLKNWWSFQDLDQIEYPI